MIESPVFNPGQQFEGPFGKGERLPAVPGAWFAEKSAPVRVKHHIRRGDMRNFLPAAHALFHFGAKAGERQEP